MKERGKWLVFDQENPDNNGIKDGEQVLVYIKNLPLGHNICC